MIRSYPTLQRLIYFSAGWPSLMPKPFNTMSASKHSLTVCHDKENKEFMIVLDGSDRAVLQYDVLDAKSVDLQHTVVPPSYRGQGIAKILAKYAFDHFASEEINMRLTCTYLQKFFQENPKDQYRARIINP